MKLKQFKMKWGNQNPWNVRTNVYYFNPGGTITHYANYTYNQKNYPTEVIKILIKEFGYLIEDKENNEDIKNENVFKYKLKSLYEQIVLMMENPGQFKGFYDSERQWQLFTGKILDLKLELNELTEFLIKKGQEPASEYYLQDNENVQFSCSHQSVLLRNIKKDYDCEQLQILDHSTLKTKHSKGVSCLIFLNEKILITGGYDYRIKIWDWVKQKLLKTKKVMEIAVSFLIVQRMEKKFLISGHDGGYLVVFETTKFTVKCMQKIAESKISQLFSICDGNFVAAGSFDGTITLFNLEELRSERQIQAHNEAINCMDQQRFAGILATGADDCLIKIWQLQNQDYERNEQLNIDQDNSNPITLISSIENHGQKVLALTFLLSNHKIILSGCYNKIIA
eukprot:TRINITY_DN1974_c0_g2_i2.p1 TRINITY_DN1974_c0_g2~~TRINITY_DN1974_c0_g2_i2.p1  ORF type:complete len:395 (-),score=41.88 TRINITY_DN1974_c0_g2_i2:585-1769(-)